jgi:hypothetical protein
LSVSEADLKTGEGKVTIDLGDMDGVTLKQVSIPAGAAGIMGNKPLELKSGSFSLTIPAEVLEELQALAPSEGLADARIWLKITPAAAGSLDLVLQQAGTAVNAEITQAGVAYEFSLSVILKDGTEKMMSRFVKPVSLMLTADAGSNRDLTGIYYIGDTGIMEYIGGAVEGNKVTANIGHFSTYAVLQYSKSFADVGPDFWAYNDIRFMAAKHIAAGKSESLFDPRGKITRAEFAALLVRSLGLEVRPEAVNPFSDVAADSWYSDSVQAAYDAKLIEGSDAAHFKPNEPITREEMAVMIYRALKLHGGAAATSEDLSAVYSDHSSISSWAREAVNATLAAGLVNGRSKSTLEPKSDSTRAEAVTVLARLLK